VTVNPFVAARIDQPKDAWAGVWIAEDIELIAQGVQNGSWIDGTLGVIGAGLDALAIISDPLGTLLQYGVAWLIEHVKPLSDALDWLAGDPAQISAHAQTWRNVAVGLRTDADELIRAARWDTVEWTGSAADAYRTWASQRGQGLQILATASDTMALITEGAGMLIATVRVMVRDAVATVVSRLVDYAIEELGSFGFATPLVVEQVVTLCASWAAKIATWLRALINSLRKLGHEAGRLGIRIDELRKILERLRGHDAASRHAVGGDALRQSGGHATRPRNQIDYERQERWAGEAYDDIRANPDADVIARNVSDVPRRDGSTGFAPEEVEQIRRHMLFEEHPLTDYDGGIVHQRYDPSPDMAEAWLRLRSGRHRPEDIVLLEHELAESRYYSDHPGATYEQAHAAANGVANWQNRIPEPTYEDYSEPWR
jgi:hypothetical protein